LQWQTLQYSLNLHAEFQSIDCDGCLIGLAPNEEIDFNWVIELASGAQHRDSSHDIHLRIVDSEAKDSSGTKLSLDYDDRTVLLRSFQSGELLKIDHSWRLSGPERHMDVFDLIFPLLFPSPPALDEGATHMESMRWPVRWTPSSNGTNQLLLEWQFVANDNDRVQIDYGGDWSTDGRWNHLAVNGKGEATGQVWLAPNGGLAIEHRFKWMRELCYEGSRRLCQQQQFSGVLERK